jgi:hypothetical protein
MANTESPEASGALDGASLAIYRAARSRVNEEMHSREAERKTDRIEARPLPRPRRRSERWRAQCRRQKPNNSYRNAARNGRAIDRFLQIE